MTESGIQNPESGEPTPPALFSCCSTARAFLVASVLVLNGSGSFLAMSLAGMSFTTNPDLNEALRIYCMCSYVVALIASLAGLVGVLIDGVSGCGEITLRGRSLRRKLVGLVFLGAFTLPWLLLVVFSWIR